MDIQPFNRAHLAEKWWRPPNFRWQYATYALVGVAIIVTVGIFVMPEESDDSRVAQEVAAAQAREKKIAEILANPGEIIYIEPGTNPFPTRPPSGE